MRTDFEEAYLTSVAEMLYFCIHRRLAPTVVFQEVPVVQEVLVERVRGGRRRNISNPRRRHKRR